MPKLDHSRSSDSQSRQAQSASPRFLKLTETTTTHDAALASLENFIDTARMGGPFAPRDDVIARLQLVRKAMLRDKDLVRRSPSPPRKKRR